MGMFMQGFKAGEMSQVNFQMEGKKVCRQAFLFLTSTTKWKLQNLKCHYNQEGFISRRHGNTGRSPHNSYSFNTINAVKEFIEIYAENHGVLLLGRIPGHRDDSIISNS